MRAGERRRIAAASPRADPRTPEAELAALQALVAAAGADARAAAADEILPGVTLEQRLRGRTLTLKLKGRGVTPELAAAVQARSVSSGRVAPARALVADGDSSAQV